MFLENGVIRTMDPSLPVVRALAIAGPVVAGGVGTHESALPSPEHVDLGGRCVLPAFADAHVHFPTWALRRREVRLEGTASLGEALDRVRRAPVRDGWIRGGGWRDAGWETPPSAEALDAVAGDTPAALWARDLHTLWLNSAALRLAGAELDAPGGVVERDAAGAPTGILREAAATAYARRHLVPGEDELVDATREGIREAHARGLASIHDLDGGLGAAGVFSRLRADGALTLRVWQSLPHERLDELARLGLRSGLGDDYFRLGYLKVFMDGTLGSGTAWMLDGEGVCLTSAGELTEIVREAAVAGWPVAVHAIGDRANREALDAFEATRTVWHALGLRQRIEHAQCVHPADAPRFAALGVACSVQPSHAPSDRDVADRHWPGHDGAYAYRTLLDAGAVLASGSDAPVEELDPLAGVRAAVLRTLDERSAWRPEQALTVEQALAAATLAPAWLAGDERRRGKLRPGYLADLVVLDRDPVTCEPDELEAVSVVATMVGGRWVHTPPPWD